MCVTKLPRMASASQHTGQKAGPLHRDARGASGCNPAASSLSVEVDESEELSEDNSSSFAEGGGSGSIRGVFGGEIE